MKIKPFNEKLAQLTRLLSDGHYHDGTELGQALDVTRSAVWKMVRKLEQYGVVIEAVPGHGYLLHEPLFLLEVSRIQAYLPADVEWIVLESISSTNDYFALTRHAQNSVTGIRCCWAEHQTQARGRLHRSWHSPFGKNLYFSCHYPFQRDISELAGLSLVISLSVLATLHTLQLNDVHIKWPNDVLYHGKKIAGILIDVQAESHGSCAATIGIGLNVNMDKTDDPDIDQAWTSLRIESGRVWDRNEVAAVLLQHVLADVGRFAQYGFSAFMDAWIKADGLRYKHISLNHIHQKITGTAVGINERGHLLLQLDDGRIAAFSSGDVSLIRT